MEYTVQQLARLAGITSRTLRYYDEMGILKPARVRSSGYRIYGQDEVDQLQQVMFYRELGMSLNTIKEIVTNPNFDRMSALKYHHEQLLDKRMQLDVLLTNVEKTIALNEGRITMSDKEKFQGFKQQMIADNETKYGRDIRLKYGTEVADKSNEKLLNMTSEQYEAFTQLEHDVKSALADAFRAGDPASALAQKAVDLHKQWLNYSWPEYTPEAHAGLAQMYVDDERFRAYYDEAHPGMAEFLRDAIHMYTGYKQ